MLLWFFARSITCGFSKKWLKQDDIILVTLEFFMSLKHAKAGVEREETIQLRGNFLLFYAFDVGDEISLKNIQASKNLPTFVLPLSSGFKNYHIPLSFQLSDCDPHGVHRSRTDCISAKIHSFGVMSL